MPTPYRYHSETSNRFTSPPFSPVEKSIQAIPWASAYLLDSLSLNSSPYRWLVIDTAMIDLVTLVPTQLKIAETLSERVDRWLAAQLG